ncbi:hypothetical protein GCM10022392_22890 [Mucilaginibacter panaciglaebae]|uniref:Uncharacterized protein n=2 Tax=Mucilaginibacter panaciglaebae TaxID=502331 RepID=A0ABP7WYI4_9SPHI
MIMKTILTLILLCALLPQFALAQKAYDAVHYLGKQDGQIFRLTLGNGYLAASKIKLLPANGKPIIFNPDSAIPDDKDQLTFHAKGHTDYLIMNNMKESYDSSPETMVGRYWSGQRWAAVEFVLGR